MDDFISNRYQTVVINSQTSKYAPENAGVPQGSIFEPLFFLVYIKT